MKLVAVTACPTGIAHTYMAAEALQMAAKSMGIDIKVETQGSVGIENQITAQELKEAHAVIIAADTKVDKSRFQGKPIVEVSVKEAISDAKGLIERAAKMEKRDFVDQIVAAKQEQSSHRNGVYKHLMTGVSHMIPFIVAGGLLIAISFVFGIDAFKEKGTLAATLMDIGGGSAFALMVPILAGYISYSISDRPGLAPGMIGGMVASKIGAGFLGGMVAGFLAGYVTLWLKENIKLPKVMEGLKPVLILPFISTFIVGMLMVYVIGTPIKGIMDVTTTALKAMSSANAGILGLILGAMMALDMGGPINKVAYTFGLGLLGNDIFEPMAATMAGGMVPPLGLALATYLSKDKFTVEERKSAPATALLGLSFITEGAIPFAAADPFKVIPSIIAGSSVAGALSMMFGCTLRAPCGGIFVVPIPNAVGNLGMYAVSILVGTVVTAVLVILLKSKITTDAERSVQS